MFRFVGISKGQEKVLIVPYLFDKNYYFANLFRFAQAQCVLLCKRDIKQTIYFMFWVSFITLCIDRIPKMKKKAFHGEFMIEFHTYSKIFLSMVCN